MSFWHHEGIMEEEYQMCVQGTLSGGAAPHIVIIRGDTLGTSYLLKKIKALFPSGV